MGWPQIVFLAWVSYQATKRLHYGARRFSLPVNVIDEVIHWAPCLLAVCVGGFFS